MNLLSKAKRTVSLIILSNIIMMSYAVIAYPGLVEFRQSNGDVVKIRMRGSESLKWAETEDGYTLVYDRDGNLVYGALDKNGNLEPTDIVATDISERGVEVNERLESIGKRLTYSPFQIKMARQISQARVAQMNSLKKTSSVGTVKMLLILVEFSDYSFKKSKEDFDKLMNQLNYTDEGRYGSVRDYYKENSFEQLDLVTDVAGIYRLKYNRAYYGANDANSNDSNPRAMASEAVSMANADVNFKDYDNDGDGVVDGVHIIYAGPGEEAGGGSDCIWAHAWTVSETVDGVRTLRYSCSPEIRGSWGSNITHIGVICHEIGHVLGTSDFYDTDYGVGGEYPGTGEWDIMGIGSWNADGACPAHFNPYSKIYDFGWSQAMQISENKSVKLTAKTKDNFVRINTRTSGEYFLLEYRAQSRFDSFIPGHGLMIYRASENLNNKELNTLNASHKQQFYPVAANASFELPTSEASSYGNPNSSSAPFPGSLNKKEFTNFTIPSMKSWNGLNTQFPITSIVENTSQGYVTFDVTTNFVPTTISPSEGEVENLSEIIMTFPRPVALYSGTRNVSLESVDNPYIDYAKNLKTTVSSDGLKVIITGTPSKSIWTVGERYKLSFSDGFFIDNSTGVSSKPLTYYWTITTPEPVFFTPEITPSGGEVTKDEILTTVVTFPSPVTSFDGSEVSFSDGNDFIMFEWSATGTISDDRLSLTIAWDFVVQEDKSYTLNLPSGCIVLENGEQNEQTSVEYTVISSLKDTAEFTVPEGINGYINYNESNLNAWTPEFPFTVSTTQNNTVLFSATLPSLPTGLSAMEVVDENNEAIATLSLSNDALLADNTAEYQVAGETTKEFVDGAKIRFYFRFAHSQGVTETIRFGYVVAGGTITGAEAITLDGNVIVRGNEIIAPQGAIIYTANGVQVAPKSLAPGIYVVDYNGKAVKVMVK